MEKGRLVHSEFIFIKMHRFLGRIKIDRQCQRRTVILIQSYGSYFFARKVFNNGIFAKRKVST